MTIPGQYRSLRDPVGPRAPSIGRFGDYFFIAIYGSDIRNLRRKREPRDVPLDIESLNALLRASIRKEERSRDGRTAASVKAEAARARYVITKA